MAENTFDESRVHIPHCPVCGQKLGVFVGMQNGKPLIIGTSDYMETFDLCHTCLVEHCMQTNCYKCELRKYPDCEFLATKKLYLEMNEEARDKAEEKR